MATKSIAWQTGSGNITLTYQGQGDGPISVQSDENNGAARSQVVTIETTAGTPVVTKNVTVSQAACPFPVGDVKNFSYTGSYQEIELPAGQYKLQCWGAQGGSNGTNSTYGITAKAGGKGGYSEGVITLSQKTTVRVYVGGKGTSTTGGFNGGGTASGTSSYNSGGHFGISKFGGGGGATDIRLSDGSLYSRMIVAGGGSGGAMCYKSVTTSTQQSYTDSTLTSSGYGFDSVSFFNIAPTRYYGTFIPCSSYRGALITVYTTNATRIVPVTELPTTSEEVPKYASGWSSAQWVNETSGYTVPSNANYLYVELCSAGTSRGVSSVKFTWTETTTTTDSTYANGYVGGGETAGSYGTGFPGKQNEAGLNGSFGQGANQAQVNTRYVAAAGGGGWYGGGSTGSDSDISYNRRSGGGSGWVNIYSNRGSRPSGYTGLQLDSGTTYIGYGTSFPAPGGGNETGHSGNGYARITRLS